MVSERFLGKCITHAKLACESFIADKCKQGVFYNRTPDNNDFTKIAEIFIKMRAMYATNPETLDADIWESVISNHMEKVIGVNAAALTDIKDSDEFIIPVKWQVISTVTVRNVKNAAEALRLVLDNIEEIPISPNPDYKDGSYEVDIDCKNDLYDAQDYKAGDVVITKITKPKGITIEVNN